MIMGSLGACKDEINLPDYVVDHDEVYPHLVRFAPVPDSVYTGLTSLPIHIEVVDDRQVGEVKFIMVPRNHSDPGVSITRIFSGDSAVIDTTYTIPTTDSLGYDALLIASDWYGNIVSESYTFATKD